MNLDKRELELKGELDQALLNGEDTTKIRAELTQINNQREDSKRLEDLNRKKEIENKIATLEEKVRKSEERRAEAKKQMPIVEQEIKDLEKKLEEKKEERSRLQSVSSSGNRHIKESIRKLKAELKSI